MKLTLLLVLALFISGQLLSAENKSLREKIFAPHFGPDVKTPYESVSGIGSSLKSTEAIRRVLPNLLKELECKTMLDLPCGDFHWMKTVDLPVDLYIGADCISALIDKHVKQYSSPNRLFTTLDALTQPIPKVDLIFCRDMLIHLSNAEIIVFFKNVKKSGSRYLLTTHYTQKSPNKELVFPGARFMNLTLPPFNLPEPLLLINEEYVENGISYPERNLALWEIADIKGFD